MKHLGSRALALLLTLFLCVCLLPALALADTDGTAMTACNVSLTNVIALAGLPLVVIASDKELALNLHAAHQPATEMVNTA